MRGQQESAVTIVWSETVERYQRTDHRFTEVIFTQDVYSCLLTIRDIWSEGAWDLDNFWQGDIFTGGNWLGGCWPAAGKFTFNTLPYLDITIQQTMFYA